MILVYSSIRACTEKLLRRDKNLISTSLSQRFEIMGEYPLYIERMTSFILFITHSETLHSKFPIANNSPMDLSSLACNSTFTKTAEPNSRQEEAISLKDFKPKFCIWSSDCQCSVTQKIAYSGLSAKS